MKYLAVLCWFILMLSYSIGCVDQKEDDSEDKFGPYEITINRVHSNETDLNYIYFAENLPPEYGFWWNETFDFVRIPLVVWNESIQYYVGLVEDFQQNHSYDGFDIFVGRVNYTATVAYIHNLGQYNASAELLVMVNLNLSFGEGCGGACACRFRHYRQVILAEDFEIIEVLGDYIRPQVIVS